MYSVRNAQKAFKVHFFFSFTHSFIFLLLYDWRGERLAPDTSGPRPARLLVTSIIDELPSLSPKTHIKKRSVRLTLLIKAV